MMKLEANKSGNLNCTLNFACIEEPECTVECTASWSVLSMKGTFCEGKIFAIAVNVLVKNGFFRMEGGKCVIEGVEKLQRVGHCGARRLRSCLGLKASGLRIKP